MRLLVYLEGLEVAGWCGIGAFDPISALINIIKLERSGKKYSKIISLIDET
jgi:hypothetical protein